MHKLLSAFLALFLSACAVKPSIVNEYQLTSFNNTNLTNTPSRISLLISQTTAVEGFQTNQMQYVSKPFTLTSFAKNGWTSPPAAMIYPLLVQSFQASNYFHAIGSGSFAGKTDYQLDTLLLELQQSFLTHPSMLTLKLKAILSNLTDNSIIASHTFSYKIPCPQDTPYGGVIAANQATQLLTKDIRQFVIRHINGVVTIGGRGARA